MVPAARKPSLVGSTQFRLLNETIDLDAVGGWQAPGLSYLLRYNLHYFDDLNALDSTSRRDWHAALIARWVTENPPVAGVGWEPYPTSLRIVNWIKWTGGGGELDAAAQQSLAIQVRHLRRRLEHHLLGNHLYSNAKALVFAGCYFDSAEAQRWLQTGLTLIARELDVQILADGGHFERSPMYHALALEDLLDLINLAQVYPDCIAAQTVRGWRDRAASMRRWLALMCHPDGEVSHFNDSVAGVAPSPAALHDYADRLAVPAPAPAEPLERLAASGYLRLQLGEALLLIDAAPIGPDYLPGHAHADSLSFELSLRGQRILVNSGIDRYGSDAERVRQRGSAAHNCVVVDGEDSSEVWSGFRVARRARPQGLKITCEDGAIVVECAHDGYRRLPGAVIHQRRWRLDEHGLQISDQLSGSFIQAAAHFHLHPASRVQADGVVALPDGRTIEYAADGAVAMQEDSYQPGFGQRQAAQTLVLQIDPRCASATLTLRW